MAFAMSIATQFYVANASDPSPLQDFCVEAHRHDLNSGAVNTLGVSIGRVDFGPYGLNTPHVHPLGSEIFAVLEGTLYAGFVTTKNKLYDTTDALAIATFGSQNPGRINIADGVFGTPILDEVLTKAFQVNEKAIEQLRAQFSTNNASVDNPRKSVLRLLSQLSR
uniref:Cupin type-1 domain-containing protein n=1 Tax=Chenopodium quinoa TaxID=63459 RepID=A0A803MSI9_CHEQI